MPSTKVFLGVVGKKTSEPVGLTMKMYEFDEAMLGRLNLGEDVKKGERRWKGAKKEKRDGRSRSATSRRSPSADRKKRVSFKKAKSFDAGKPEKSEERALQKCEDRLKKEEAKKEKLEAKLEAKRLLKEKRIEKRRTDAVALLARDFQKMAKRNSRRH